jgi:uncharacterized membrane protein
LWIDGRIARPKEGSMNETIEVRTNPVVPLPEDALVKLTHLIYALHAASVVIGIAGSATIVGAFVFGIPSILAVIINYVKRGDVRGTYLESHFSWQIRTFWWALLWLVVGVVLAIVLVGFAILFVVGIWVIYRIIRGWWALSERRPMPV